jgi:hypothetical protein
MTEREVGQLYEGARPDSARQLQAFDHRAQDVTSIEEVFAPAPESRFLPWRPTNRSTVDLVFTVVVENAEVRKRRKSPVVGCFNLEPGIDPPFDSVVDDWPGNDVPSADPFDDSSQIRVQWIRRLSQVRETFPRGHRDIVFIEEIVEVTVLQQVICVTDTQRVGPMPGAGHERLQSYSRALDFTLLLEAYRHAAATSPLAGGRPDA